MRNEIDFGEICPHVCCCPNCGTRFNMIDTSIISNVFYHKNDDQFDILYKCPHCGHYILISDLSIEQGCFKMNNFLGFREYRPDELDELSIKYNVVFS